MSRYQTFSGDFMTIRKKLYLFEISNWLCVLARGLCHMAVCVAVHALYMAYIMPFVLVSGAYSLNEQEIYGYVTVSPLVARLSQVLLYVYTLCITILRGFKVSCGADLSEL